MFDSGVVVNKKIQLAALLLASSIVLSSCGARTEDGDGFSQPIFNANGELISGGDGVIPTLGQANPLDELQLRVVSDVNSLATGGTDMATITVLAINGNNNAVADAQITFSSSGGVLQNIVPLTDINGEASATLRLPQDFQNQDITITASASEGKYVTAIKVTATGSQLEVTGPDNLISGDTAEFTLRLTAGNGEPIANELVSVVSAAGNTISPSELATNADGRVDFMVGSENSSDTLRIGALNNTVSAVHSFDVVEDLLSFINIKEGDELLVGQDTLVRVNWVSQGEPVVGQALSFAMTAGRVEAPSTVVTDAQGNASVLVSSNSAGPAKITVEATQGGAPATDFDVEFIATEPKAILVGASSSRVNINETSTITALVTDRLGNPVKNREVTFAGADLKGGQLNPASAVTNSAGIASVTFTAGKNATEQDEINVEATVKNTDINHSMDLTVFKRSLNVTLGSANIISIKPLGTQFSMPLIVQVADGSGTPLENATVRVSVRPVSYFKGFLELVNVNGKNVSAVLEAGGDFDPDSWSPSGDVIGCPAEDRDGDRILDTLGQVSEDTNNNGTLDPQDPASIAAVDGDFATLSGGTLQTDKNGSGYFELIYPASNALWSNVEITARAEALGAEATDTYSTMLGMPGEQIKNTNAAPDNVYSPYGTADLRNTVISVGIVDDLDQYVFEGCTTTY